MISRPARISVDNLGSAQRLSDSYNDDGSLLQLALIGDHLVEGDKLNFHRKSRFDTLALVQAVDAPLFARFFYDLLDQHDEKSPRQNHTSSQIFGWWIMCAAVAAIGHVVGPNENKRGANAWRGLKIACKN